MTSPSWLSSLEALEAAATKGPWSSDRRIWWENVPGEQERHGAYEVSNEDEDCIAALNESLPYRENGDLIAAARNALPKLLALAKLAHEFADVLHGLQEDGDWNTVEDTERGYSIVGMESEDAKDWLDRFDAIEKENPNAAD